MTVIGLRSALSFAAELRRFLRLVWLELKASDGAECLQRGIFKMLAGVAEAVNCECRGCGEQADECCGEDECGFAAHKD